MLSYNLFLLRDAKLRNFDRRNLWMIFSIIYLDMYDLALYIGYAIFLSPAFLHHMHFYQSGMYFSLILIAGQLAKVVGYFRVNISYTHLNHNQYSNLCIIALCYLAIFVILYEHLTLGSLLVLAVIRIIQGYSFGKEIGFVIDHTRKSFITVHHHHIYYFVLFSGELGAGVSILINRTLMSHDYKLVANLDAWYFQLLFACVYLFIVMLIRFIYPVTIIKNDYHVYKFRYMVKHEGRTIFLRSLVTLFHILLIFLLVFRFPIFLHIGYHLNNAMINKMLIFITVIMVLGVRGVVVVHKYASSVNIMRCLFIFIIVWSFAMAFTPYHVINLYYTMFVIALVYGAFIRITPEYLYNLKDFHPDLVLVSRYTSYFIGYHLIAPFLVLSLDMFHYYTHTYEDDALSWVSFAAAIIGFTGFIFYNRLIISRQ